jgi:phosphatidate cytidylyltransferase
MNQLLKNLPPNQQVAVLFVALFGLLGIVTVWLLVRGLRHQNKKPALPLFAPQSDGSEFAGLLRQSWIMAMVFWLSWALGDLGASVLFAVIALFCFREFVTISPTHRGDHRSLVLAFFVVCPLQFWLAYSQHVNLFSVLIPVYVFFALPVVSALSPIKQRFLERNAAIQWGIMVCLYGLSHVPALYMLKFPNYAGKNAFLVFFLFGVVQVALVVQHVVKRIEHRRRTSAQPQGEASPSSPAPGTWARIRPGFIGVMVASLLGGLFAGLTPFVPGQAFASAFVASTVGLCGHFILKIIKKDHGLPLWNNTTTSVTGSSGFLDKFGALCFAAPVFFHLVRWYFKVGV